MPRTFSAAAPAPHLSALTGARFVAAIAVLLCHFGPQADWPKWVTAHGREAVAFFFVLSGFVLAYNYADRPIVGGKQAYARFLQARFARIYPVHLLVLLLITPLTLTACRLDPAMVWNATTADLAKTWMQNALLVQSYSTKFLALGGWSGASWSVSCEATFYLAFPLLLGQMRRLKTPRAIAWAAACSWLATAAALLTLCAALHFLAGRNAAALESWTYHAPYLRIGEFVTGCLTGLWFVRSGPAAWPNRVTREFAAWGGLGAAMTIAGLQNYGVIPLLVSNGAIFTPLFAVAILAVASGPTSLGRLLSGRRLCQLGEASYSLYLVHSIFVVSVNWFHGNHASTPMALTAIALSVAASVAMFHAVEDPCRKWLRSGPKPVPQPVRLPVATPLSAAA